MATLQSAGSGHRFESVKHNPRINAEDDGSRPLGRALKRGWRRSCPNCGGAGLFTGYLKVRDNCPTCGEALHHHRADDMPAWLTIILVAHLIAPAMLFVYDTWDPPLWVHWTVWPTLALTGTLLLLPRMKAMVVALQWAQRMHGFGSGSGS